MHQDLCGGRWGLCPEMIPINGQMLKDYLLQVKFEGLSGEQFQFLPNGDGPSRYRILNFRQRSAGHYEWITVGYFKDGHLANMNMRDLRYQLNEHKHPESVCSVPCTNGQYIKGDKCCWTCIDCTAYQFLRTRYECRDCEWGTIPSQDKSYCIDIPQVYLTYDNAVAVGAMTFAALGILATVAVMQIFFKYNKTPVVKASGKELSFVLLIGIFLCYSVTFLLVSKPSVITCGAQQYGMGFSFTVCYAAIMTKTNRISRIFRAGKRTIKRPKFISPRSQLFICGALVSVQVAIGVLWLIMSPPKDIPFYANRDDHQLVCAAAVGSSYMIGLSYPILLIIVCTIYAILTRKIPEAFNESKFIGFTMYTTCIIWLAFVPIYFSTANNIQIRIATICFSISLSATIALVCMFTPKLHIILIRPDRNVRQSMMATKTASSKLNSSSRMDSGTQSDEVEMTQRLKSSGSFSSGFSRSTSATQTCSNANSISTQTLNYIGMEFDDMEFDDMDVEL